MQRILDPAQIEAFAERAIPRVRLFDPASLFAARARRLRALAVEHALGDYLRLMAALADAQQGALDKLVALSRPGVPASDPPKGRGGAASSDPVQYASSPPSRAGKGAQSELAHAHRMPLFQAAAWPRDGKGARFELAHAHKMPLFQAAAWPRDGLWLTVLSELCTSIAAASGFPAGVRSVCERILASDAAATEAQADILLAARTHEVDAQAAPFVMAALQVYWASMVASLEVRDVAQIDVPGVCPVCGTLPVSSIVRADKRHQGYRYLHCALCATEWHLVRIVCSHCQATEGIAYHTIEGGSDAVRAESCGQCHTYRKILHQEKDPGVEPVADDLATIALDLLMTEEGFHRGSGNPLLWQNTEG
jgi:FdhE protein